jgi:hypothetical protein
MPMSDKVYADRLFHATSIVAVLCGVVLVALGIASLAADVLSDALTIVAFSAAGLAFGSALHLGWLRRRLRSPFDRTRSHVEDQ